MHGLFIIRIVSYLLNAIHFRNTAQKDGYFFRITTTQNVKVGSVVNLISDFEKEQKLLNETGRRKIEIKKTKE